MSTKTDVKVFPYIEPEEEITVEKLPMPTPIRVTREQLKKILGRDPSPELFDALNNCFEKYDIKTPIQIRYFLANILHESGNLTRMRENMNYSAEGLLKTFPKYFSAPLAKAYARQPERIGSRVYANRMGNGTEASKDGWNYRGGGAIQLTGKSNYRAYQASLQGNGPDDLVKNPEKIVTFPHYIWSAGFYWKSNNLNRFCTPTTFLKLCQTINGSGSRTPNGWNDRQARLKVLEGIIK